jgi:hypothetical protein
MATIYSLSEQIILKIYGRTSTPSDALQLPDVKMAVVQAANSALKVQYFESMKMGERIMNNLVMAEYPKQPLVTYGGKKSICKLPAIPVNLPRNQGIWMVSTDPYFECLGIPMGSGQQDLLRSADMISNLMGQWAYEPNGLNIITDRDLTINNIEYLYFRLIVADLSTLGDYDPLPLTPDMEFDIVQQVYQSFMPPQPVERQVDSYSSNPQTVKQ